MMKFILLFFCPHVNEPSPNAIGFVMELGEGSGRPLFFPRSEPAEWQSYLEYPYLQRLAL